MPEEEPAADIVVVVVLQVRLPVDWATAVGRLTLSMTCTEVEATQSLSLSVTYSV